MSMNKPVDCPDLLRALSETGTWVQTDEQIFFPTGKKWANHQRTYRVTASGVGQVFVTHSFGETFAEQVFVSPAGPRHAIAEAWDAWLATRDHLDDCIGHSEGQRCCAQHPQDDDPDVAYRGRQDKLLELMAEALTDAGYAIVRPA